MMNDAKLVCFCATTDAESARHFYGHVLGLALVEDSPFALVFDSGGTTLRIQRVQELAPAKHTALGWEVGNIRDEIARLAGRGVRFERYPGLEQDAHGVWASPSGALVAWFKDPDGNTLSLAQLPGIAGRRDGN